MVQPLKRAGAFYERAPCHARNCLCKTCWWAEYWHRRDVEEGNAVPFLLGGEPTWGERADDFRPRKATLLQRWGAKLRVAFELKPERPLAGTVRPPDPTPIRPHDDQPRPLPTPVPSEGQRCSR